ncbi:hypothetical protein MKW94_021163 [Papaver nudicaule]|uniref:TF-B3 domain-containing protein n=1 Tax=Papaver nudicaule TaxID=74823 RepID=A0AA41VLN0_PAPNU|nr:hypothetical protein [Papaver nudicaule]
MMLSSHVSYCFWLGLPAKFCTSNLPKEDIDMTLLDEDGKQHTVKCLPRKFGLSGGWGGFAKAHKLAPGDALVFQLVEATKFKVYIVRENGLAGDTPEEGNELAEVIDRNVTLPIASSRKPEDHINEEVLDRNIILPLASMRQPEDHSSEEVIDSEVLERIKFSDSINEIQDVADLESFTIIVNGLNINSEISENDRTKYYELCRSQKSYLHKHITPGLNKELIAGVIRETVDIADAIRASNLSTPKDEYKAWEKRLIGFKHLGMNVEFLLSRLDVLQKLALESEDALDYNKAMIRENHAKEELSTVEKKILELIRFEKEVQTLKIDAQRHAAFQSVVSSPW